MGQVRRVARLSKLSKIPGTKRAQSKHKTVLRKLGRR